MKAKKEDTRVFVTENKRGLTRHEKRKNMATSNKKNTRGAPQGFNKRTFDKACAERAAELRAQAAADKKAAAAAKREATLKAKRDAAFKAMEAETGAEICQ